MSAERFILRCIDDPIYLNEISDSSHEKALNGQKPISYFAQLLVEESSQAIKSQAEELKNNNHYQYSMEDFGTKVRDSASKDYMSVIYGNILMGLEDTSSTGSFNLKSMVDSINSTFDESGAKRINEPEKHQEAYQLDEAEMEKFHNIYKRGRTYTTFFRHPEKSLPKNLVDYFEEEPEFYTWMREMNNRFRPAIRDFLRAFNEDKYKIDDYDFNSSQIKKFKELKTRETYK